MIGKVRRKIGGGGEWSRLLLVDQFSDSVLSADETALVIPYQQEEGGTKREEERRNLLLAVVILYSVVETELALFSHPSISPRPPDVPSSLPFPSLRQKSWLSSFFHCFQAPISVFSLMAVRCNQTSLEIFERFHSIFFIVLQKQMQILPFFFFCKIYIA